MEFINEFADGNNFIRNLLLTIVLIAGLLVVRFILMKVLLREKSSREDRRKRLITIRNWVSILLILGFIIIWSAEIQAFAISLVAIAVAIAVATKELILCFVAGILNSLQHPFKIGDRIEVDGIRGDVIDADFFTTKILEIGPHNKTHQYTGRSVIIPNALFLTHKLINESFMDEFVLHVFTVRLKRSEDWSRAKEIMLTVTEGQCSEFKERARANFNRIAKKEELEVPSVDPRVRLNLGSPDEVEMIVRIPAPATRKGTIEQKIIDQFMDQFYG
jgi:small-conductance mechanosensitive channel